MTHGRSINKNMPQPKKQVNSFEKCCFGEKIFSKNANFLTNIGVVIFFCGIFTKKGEERKKKEQNSIFDKEMTSEKKILFR